ncbi:hypothetical protein, partial [Bacillus thuringiensis]|uniref:hypothetical protein n=1 Tax=Bacillus thuringiensis TaxID=1428 RepID=UPI001C93037D
TILTYTLSPIPTTHNISSSIHSYKSPLSKFHKSLFNNYILPSYTTSTQFIHSTPSPLFKLSNIHTKTHNNNNKHSFIIYPHTTQNNPNNPFPTPIHIPLSIPYTNIYTL